ncbi:MAG: hypothetical protein HYW90_02840 [Candidatus Sungbacteria bacterium]|nr:hypothetical protein [Candidatus Sungbacteria bacterium]
MRNAIFAAVSVFLFFLVMGGHAWAYVQGVKICELAPNAKVLVELSDGTVVREAITDANGVVLFKELHGNSFIIESVSKDGKRFHFEVVTPPKIGTLSVDCYKLF